jgi:Fe-S-cluster containining protein
VRGKPIGTEATEALLDALRELYRETDASNAGSSCPGSTECCRFGVTGREPYVTSIEVVAIERAVKRGGGPLSRRRRALPITTDGERERICLLLDASGRCSVYESRPFGCRTFFCQRASVVESPRRADVRDLTNRLRAIAARHEVGGDAPRPLSRVLGG